MIPPFQMKWNTEFNLTFSQGNCIYICHSFDLPPEASLNLLNYTWKSIRLNTFTCVKSQKSSQLLAALPFWRCCGPLLACKTTFLSYTSLNVQEKTGQRLSSIKVFFHSQFLNSWILEIKFFARKLMFFHWEIFFHLRI